MKIDAFCHTVPRPYSERMLKLGPTEASANIRKRISRIPSPVDLDVRFAPMDEFGAGYRQVVNIAAPPVDDLGSAAVAREMGRIGNESLAELVQSHPGRFAGFMAAVPLSDPEAAVTELDHAVGALGALGVQIYTHLGGQAMDAPQLEPFYVRAAEVAKLVQVHPCRSSGWAGYPTEPRSKFEIWWTFGWEYDLSAFMARIVFSGVLERHPGLASSSTTEAAWCRTSPAVPDPAGTSSAPAPPQTSGRTWWATRCHSGPSSTSRRCTPARPCSALPTRSAVP
jgi:predicted TIM-barrel fold metal-dependent hydrolase